jgi:Fe-S cluster biogenesis protein NfuA
MKASNKSKPAKTSSPNGEASIEERLRGLIEYLSAYIEQYHGGSVEFVSFDGKKVLVRLGGACETCELQAGTLKGWIRGTVRQFFPEVVEVEAVEER